jgi:hypothetical protein
VVAVTRGAPGDAACLGGAITQPGAQCEIKVDGVVRTHRDERENAIDAARFLQRCSSSRWWRLVLGFSLFREYKELPRHFQHALPVFAHGNSARGFHTRGGLSAVLRRFVVSVAHC